jgi:hypothetical protein
MLHRSDFRQELVESRSQLCIWNFTMIQFWVSRNHFLSSDLVLAQSAWWRQLSHNWLYLNSLDTFATVEQLIRFYVNEHNSTLPHSAFKGQTPDEMYFQKGTDITERIQAARMIARQRRIESNFSRDVSQVPTDGPTVDHPSTNYHA